MPVWVQEKSPEVSPSSHGEKMFGQSTNTGPNLTAQSSLDDLILLLFSSSHPNLFWEGFDCHKIRLTLESLREQFQFFQINSVLDLSRAIVKDDLMSDLGVTCVERGILQFLDKELLRPVMKNQSFWLGKFKMSSCFRLFPIQKM